ncbi:MAG: endonuclease/exonuclease/phosphatase family protein [Lentimicrobiaceae bacterium]|nr:endonuclease/exonuclease/phosphatase family protein [Lentimicrobiaceae bacterium]
MAKNKFSLSKILLLIPNILAVVLLLMAYLADYFNPKAYFWVALCGCLYPYILIVNLLFVLLWIFRKNKLFLLSLICILIGFGSLKRIYQFTSKQLPEGVENTFKVMSYNVQVMGLYGNAANKGEISYNQRDSIVDLLKNEQPAILCLQEFYSDNNPKTTFPTTSLIKKNIEKTNACFYMPFTRGSHQYGLAIFTKYPVVRQGSIEFQTPSTNLAMYADLKIGKDTVRVFNLHFQSLHLQKEDYIFAQQAVSDYSELSNEAIAKNSKRILRKMKKGFAVRAEQVKILSRHIQSSPYKAVVCGDFNDTPWSFTYKQIQNLLTDTYAESGKGFGNTMQFNKWLSFRIDYIFCDKSFKSYQFITLPYKASDHLPVSVYLDIQ